MRFSAAVYMFNKLHTYNFPSPSHAQSRIVLTFIINHGPLLFWCSQVIINKLSGMEVIYRFSLL